MTNRKPIIGSCCDRAYLKLLITEAKKLHSEITSVCLPIKDCSTCYMTKAASDVRNTICDLEDAYENYGHKAW